MDIDIIRNEQNRMLKIILLALTFCLCILHKQINEKRRIAFSARIENSDNKIQMPSIEYIT